MQALLACLFLHRDAPQTRQQLAVLFWPDSSQAQARNALRQLLFQLRKTWPEADQLVHADAQTVRWLPDSALDLDVAQFQSALEQCIAALARLGQLSEDRRDYAKALKYTQQLQWLDPCREPTC